MKRCGLELRLIRARSLRMAKPLQHQIVARALEIISNEAHWTRASIARTADGWPCACLDPLAYKFCAVGALYRAAVEFSVATGSNKFSRPRNMCSGRTTANMPVCRTSTMSKAAKPSSRCSRWRSLDNRRSSVDCANPWVLYRGRPTLRSVRMPTDAELTAARDSHLLDAILGGAPLRKAAQQPHGYPWKRVLSARSLGSPSPGTRPGDQQYNTRAARSVACWCCLFL